MESIHYPTDGVAQKPNGWWGDNLDISNSRKSLRPSGWTQRKKMDFLKFRIVIFWEKLEAWWSLLGNWDHGTNVATDWDDPTFLGEERKEKKYSRLFSSFCLPASHWSNEFEDSRRTIRENLLEFFLYCRTKEGKDLKFDCQISYLTSK